MNSKHLFIVLVLIILAAGILYLYNKQQPAQNIVGKTDDTKATSQPTNLTKQKTEEIDYLQTYIPKDSKSGSCWAFSLASANDKAWRCTVGNSIYDPCFEIDKNKLVCDVNPEVAKSGFALNLTEKLPTSEHSSTSRQFYWIIKLVNGTKCWLNTGTADMVNGKLYFYACDKDNVVIVGELDKSTNPWSANVAFLKENREEVLKTERTEVLKVWK